MADIVSSMRIFVRVVETGSFTAVANENNATAAQVSRAVTALEQQLQTVVLHRTTRHLSVTEPGGRFYERAKAILAAIDSATDEARGAGVSPTGRLRLHCAPGLAQSMVAAALTGYRQAYPDVFVELKIEQSMPNLVEEGYDLSLISATELPDSVYVAQPLGSAYAVMVASPDYLKRHGTPRTRDELSAHTLLMLESPVSPPDEWHIESEADARIPCSAIKNLYLRHRLNCADAGADHESSRGHASRDYGKRNPPALCRSGRRRTRGPATRLSGNTQR